jgi:phage-related minor tail protein
VGNLGQSVDRLDDKVDRLSTVNTKAKGSMGGLGKGAGIAGIALGGAAIGAGLLVAGFAKLASEAQASLAVQRTTEQIIKSTGGAARVTSEQVGALSTELSKKTGIDDESIQSASNLLLTFKNVKNAGEGQAAMFDRATSSALDLSKAGFGSVDSAAKMLGKALNDPVKGITALSRAGVTFSEEQKASIKAMAESGDMLGAQTAIMAEVESQVGGVAEATRNPMEALQTMFGNLKEEIGMALLPTINKLVDVIGPLLQQLGPPLANVAGIVAGVVAGPALLLRLFKVERCVCGGCRKCALVCTC